MEGRHNATTAIGSIPISVNRMLAGNKKASPASLKFDKIKL